MRLRALSVFYFVALRFGVPITFKVFRSFVKAARFFIDRIVEFFESRSFLVAFVHDSRYSLKRAALFSGTGIFT